MPTSPSDLPRRHAAGKRRENENPQATATPTTLLLPQKHTGLLHGGGVGGCRRVALTTVTARRSKTSAAVGREAQTLRLAASRATRGQRGPLWQEERTA